MADLTEKQIGTIAQQMLERSLLREIRTSGLTLSDDPIDRKNKKFQPLTPLKKSSAHKRMMRDDEHLFGIAVHLGKHGFVHNFGATIKKAHNVKSKNGNVFRRKSSRMNLRSRRYINKAVERSGAVAFIATKVSEARGKEIVSRIQGVFR
ncbi:Uncharacterised protein [Algoriella xinjiangensis]|uniref:hypothetical protein n=1 Tax=Algoriella xinjiangensis TaxID=684065 RepID=UPI000F63B367|nr:hypothetical protein [Algoriella xinjiangensis]VDH16844.1 Uncharacterised protein [Algoriella xinjiangensis]